MKRQDAMFVAMCVGSIVFSIVFVLPHFMSLSVPWYFPVERRWEFGPKPTPGGIAMDFYGRFAEALVAWGVAVAVSLVATKRMKTEQVPPKVASLLVAWAIALAVLVMMYYAWTLAFRVPNAAPIPDWYIPR